MDYQNYIVSYKQVDSNLFVKFTDKNSNISYENIITPELIDNLPINKFVKLLENCINSISNYNIVIKLSHGKNQLTLFLTHDTEIINLSYTIHLDKSSDNHVKSNDVLIRRIEQLERIIDENNKITVAKIFNVETHNYIMTSLTSEFIKYSKNTDHIEIYLPENTHDISRDKRNNYEIKFNYDIDPNEIFTNLKKISLSNYEYLFYFCQFCSYKNPNNSEFVDRQHMLGISNNSIEEIEFKFNYYDFHCMLVSGFDFLKPVYSDGLREIVNKQKYIKNHLHTLNIDNHSREYVIINFPKLKKIISTYISGENTLYGLLEFIKICKKHNKCQKLKKLHLIKIKAEHTNNNFGKYLTELRNTCQENGIELVIDEIIY